MSIVKEVISFLKTQDSNLKISFRSYKVGDLPYCISLRAEVCKTEINTWGVDESLDAASLKAVMELYERYVFLFKEKPSIYTQCGFFRKQYDLDKISDLNGIPTSMWLGNTSSGFATHTNLQRALDSATNELIERHILLEADLFGLSPRLSKVQSDIKALKSYIYDAPMGRTVAITKVVSHQKIVFGFGCAFTEKEAVQKSTNEVVPRYYFLEKMGKNSSDALVLDNPHIADHFDENNSRFAALLNKYDHSENKSNKISKKEISKKDFFYSVVQSEPFFVVRVVSPKLQPHFLGEWKSEHVNPLAFLQTPRALPLGLHAVG